MRWWIAVVIFGAGSALVGAEGPPDKGHEIGQYKLFQQNKLLIQELVDHTVDIATQLDPLVRVETSNNIVGRLTQEIRNAADRQDAHRVVELGQHLRTVLKDGIIPNIVTARKLIKPGSDGEKRLFKDCDSTLSIIAPLDGIVPDDGSLAKYREVRDLLREIQGTREMVGNAIK